MDETTSGTTLTNGLDCGRNIGERAGRLVSASRLIADTIDVNVSQPKYFNPIEGVSESGLRAVFSIDALVFRIRFKSETDAEKLRALCATVQCDGTPYETQTNRRNSYRFMECFELGGTTVRLSIGFIEASSKTNMRRGKLEFNPNKCATDKRLGMLIDKVSRFARSCELVRYDMAIDFPIEREGCRLCRKDKRMRYEYISSNSTTEYLGTRNKEGYVKLYDKTKEAGLSAAWTRLEMTCAGEWSVEEVKARLPRVYAWDGHIADGTRKFVQCIGRMLAVLVGYGEPVEPYISGLDVRTRRRIMEYLATPALNLRVEDIEHVVEQAHGWAKRMSASE